MAGVLQFQITADAQQYVNALNQSTTATGGLINKAGALNSMVLPETARRMSFLREATSATKDTTQAFTASMIFLGQSAAPQLTSGLFAATEGFKALRGVMALAGVGMVGGAGIVTGVAGAFFLWSEGIKSVRAELEEIKTGEDLLAQFDRLKPKLMEMLDLNMKIGRISEHEGVGLKNRLIGANTAELRQSALSNAQKALGKINQENIRGGYQGQLESELKELSIQMLDGPARLKAEFSAVMDKKMISLMDMANKAGLDEKGKQAVLNAINGVVRAEFDRIDKNAATKTEPMKAGSNAIQNVSALEKIGLVIGNGRGVGGTDAALTAKNTFDMVNLMRIQVAVLNKFPPLLTGGVLLKNT